MTHHSALFPEDIKRPTAEEFEQLRILVFKQIGIQWDTTKVDLAYTRLRRRLLTLGLQSFSQYIDYLKQNVAEYQQMINAVTTNTTEFFRENHQFDFLIQDFFPAIIENPPAGRKLRIWSAGCSTGEEAYTLAMLTLENLGSRRMKEWDTRILASDVSTSALQKAEEGFYTEDDVSKLPNLYVEKYFQKGRRHGEIVYRVDDSLRALIQFRIINFLAPEYPVKTLFDLIFCRNVLIYFNKETQGMLTQRFQNMLAPGGYLCLGHSESLQGLQGFIRLKYNIFQKSDFF
ncbi:MAG: chemotaxis protein CheR [SAR324 cluster bacterium]|nr:chemotaxis protein CheR [SAR324 cluster bacterium]